jgi:hypothetical protein
VQSRELIRDNLIRSAERVLAHVEDMRDHAFVFPTANGGCHTLWVLGHLAYIEALVVRRIMLGGTNPLAGWEQGFDVLEPTLDRHTYPSFDEVLTTCRDTRASTLTLLDALGESDLDNASANLPAGWEDTFGTYRQCLQFAADHWYMHRGHLADARRAAGLNRMWV